MLTNVLALVYGIMFTGSMPMLHNGQQVDREYTHETLGIYMLNNIIIVCSLEITSFS